MNQPRIMRHNTLLDVNSDYENLIQKTTGIKTSQVDGSPKAAHLECEAVRSSSVCQISLRKVTNLLTFREMPNLLSPNLHSVSERSCTCEGTSWIFPEHGNPSNITDV